MNNFCRGRACSYPIYIYLISVLIPFLFNSETAIAQLKQKKDELKMEKNIYGDRFKIFNNYVNFGAGFSEAVLLHNSFIPAAVEYNFHVKRSYFMAGYQRTDIGGLFHNIIPNRMSDVHFCFGFRRENKVLNIAYYGGISRTWGVFNDTSGFRGIGIYAEAQFIRKLFYDVGAGISIFAHYNSDFPLFGVRIDIFLSGAYQGKLNSQ